MRRDLFLDFGAKEVHVKREQFEKTPCAAALLKLAGEEYDKSLFKKAGSVDRNVAEVLFIRYVAAKMAECKK